MPRKGLRHLDMVTAVAGMLRRRNSTTRNGTDSTMEWLGHAKIMRTIGPPTLITATSIATLMSLKGYGPNIVKDFSVVMMSVFAT